MTANLPTSATIVAAANLPSANAATATDSVEQSLYFTVPVYGVASVEQFDAYFTKSGANSWDVAIFNHSALTVGQFPYSGGALGAATLQFDPTTGLLTPASAHSLALTIASGQQVSLDLSAMTQSAAPFSLSNQSIYLAGDNISFAQGSTATLQIEAGDAPSALLQNFLPSGSVNSQETIDLRGVGPATSAIIGAGNVAIVSGGTSAPVTLHFDPATDFAGYHLALSGDGASGSNVKIALNTTAASGQDINDILKRIDVGGASSVANTHYTITLTGNINLAAQLDAVNLASGDSLTIVGGDHTLNGEGQYRGFLDYAGALDLQNLTIANALAVGGSGGAGGGGGGAGLGGGLFVASGASASLENVTFINDHAVGGDGASAGSYGGGGGGLGGQGGASGGGGGAGLGANGGDPYSFNSPGSGIILGAAGGGSDPANSGASGAGGSNGGGGAGDGFASVGGGGGVGGLATGQGGFGGGGGSGAGVNAGAGGFGGGGGAVSGVGFAAGAGGFGGGGGGAPIGASAGAAGFGAGAGSVSSGGGGGGLGAGGAIFVESGGALTYASGSESGSVVSGGSGGYTSPFGQTPVQAGGGEALGGAIFLQGAATLVLKPVVDDHLLISSAIADPTGSGGIGANAGAASVHIEGLGGVTFAGANTYSGGTLIDAGAMLTLSLGGSVGIGGVTDNGSLNIGDSGVYAFLGAVTGAGSIAIAAGKAVTLAFSGAAPTVAVNGFTTGDAIDLKSVAYASGQHLGASGGVTQVLGIHDDVLASLDIIGATPSAYSLTHDSNNDLFISDGGVLQALNETAALALPNGALSSQAGAALAGDSGANGSTVQVESIANGSLGSPVYGDYGALDLQANGTYSYQLFNAPQTGTTEHDVFGYTVGDAQGHTANVTLDISVLAPTAPAAPTIQAIVGQPTIHSKVELMGVGIVGDTIALYADGGASSVGVGTVGSTGAFDITTNLSFTQGPHTFVAAQTGPNSLTSQPSPGFNVDVASADVATCAQFLAGRATLDALADGFDIFDSAANVSANFDALNSDMHIDAIHLTDTGEPILTLTIAQALADTAAAHAINNAPFGIDIVDTQAHLAVLSAPSIAALAAEGVIELTSKDATVRYTFSQSAAIQAANLILRAPANDFARETFSNGSSFVYYFGPTDALTKQVSTKVDGTFDALYLAAPGVFSGVNYAQYDVGFSKAGVRISDTYYDPTGAVLGSQTFTGNGGWSMYLAGAIVKQRTVQNGGAFDVYHYSSPGTFSGVNYGAFDVSFTASGSRNGETYYDANGGVLASETVASNGGFTLYIGGFLAEQRTINPDGTSEAAFTNVQGQTYSSYQNAFSKTGVQLLHSVDNLNGAGVTNILGAGLEFGSGGAINLIGGADDFFYAPHSMQTYTFFANAAQDIIDFAPHFGVATVKGFGAASASTDVLNLSSLFTNFTQAQAAMTPVNSGFDTLITDSVGDKLTLVGVVSTSLNAGRLGLAS